MSTHQTPEPPSDAAFRRFIGLLDGKIMTNAPNCERNSSEAGWEWSLGEAVLRVRPVQLTQFPVTCVEDTHVPLSGSFYIYRSSFDIKAESSIAVIDGKSSEKSHDLWYCDAQEPGVFEWYGLYSNNTKMVPIKSNEFIDSLIERLTRAVNRS